MIYATSILAGKTITSVVSSDSISAGSPTLLFVICHEGAPCKLPGHDFATIPSLVVPGLRHVSRWAG